MENVGTIFVDLNAFHFFRIDVAADVRTLVDHQNAFACIGRLPGKDCAKESCADDKIIIFHRVT